MLQRPSLRVASNAGAVQAITAPGLLAFGPCGQRETMKTTISALLLLGLLATTTPALADPIVSTDGILEQIDCRLDPADGDGQVDRVGNVWVNVDVLDQDGSPCWT